MASKKRSRRKPNTGAIRHKPGRSLPWEAAFPIGHGDYRYDAFATWEEATAHLDRLTVERDDKEAPRNIIGGSQRVDVFLTTWLDGKRPHVKEKTFQDYTYMCDLAVAEIGNLRLDQVTRERADDLIAYFHRNGFKSVDVLRAVLRQAFQYAFEEEYIKRNPFQRVKVPPIDRRQGIALTAPQRDALLAAAATEDMPAVPLAPLWHLYARLGLRRGEGMGLRRADINFTTGTLTIVQQYTGLGSKTVLSTPKTKKSKRTLPIPPDLLDMLRIHLDEQVKRAAHTPGWEVTGLVFTDAKGRNLTYGHVEYRWRLLRARADIPQQTVIHDLRHTALTALELNGAPRNVVQAIAGHASATQTGHYTDHASVDDMRRALGS